MRETLSYRNKCLTSTCGLRERVVLMEWLGFLVSVVLRYNKTFCQSHTSSFNRMRRKANIFLTGKSRARWTSRFQRGFCEYVLRKTATNVRCKCSFRLEPSFSSSDPCVFHQGDPGDEGDIGEPGPPGLNVRRRGQISGRSMI